jgi:hypothetical protein
MADVIAVCSTLAGDDLARYLIKALYCYGYADLLGEYFQLRVIISAYRYRNYTTMHVAVADINQF